MTSAKPGNGVDLLRDGKEDTYWQSDGAQPHLINVQFQRKVNVFLRACTLADSELKSCDAWLVEKITTLLYMNSLSLVSMAGKNSDSRNLRGLQAG